MKANLLDLSLFKRNLEEKSTLMPGSIKTYLDSVSRFLSTDPNLEDINCYNEFIIKYSIKKRCHHYYSALRRFIEFKIDDSKLKHELIEGLQMPPIRNNIIRERRHLTIKQLDDVIYHLKSAKHQVIALIMKATGVRVADVLRLKEGGIIIEEYQGKPVTRINILGKRQKRNVVHIHRQDYQDIIWQYLTTRKDTVNNYYFINLGRYKNRRGNLEDDNKLILMNYGWFWQDLKQSLQTVGIHKDDFASHDFRRCFARRLWEKDKDLYKLQNALNHVDPKTTLRYLDQSGLKNIDTFYEMQMD